MKTLIMASALSIAFLAGSANANELDLTATGSSGDINGAQFFQYTAPPTTGTGVFSPFLRIQQNGVESGYNTNGSLTSENPDLDMKAGTWTHAIQLSEISLVNGYRLFALDINEPGNDKSLLSLDQVQLFVTDNPNLTGYTSGTFSGATKVYDMDVPAGSPETNNYVKMDYNASNKGSGVADILMYVPDSYFTSYGATLDPYIVLYSKMGTNFNSDELDADAGFEEWSITSGLTITDQQKPASIVPVPAAAWLLGSGLIGLAGFARRRVTAKVA